MSKETMTWLRSNIRIGYTSERGPAWHANSALDDNGQPEYLSDGSHFSGPVPQGEVDSILGVPLISAPIYAQVEGPGGRMVIKDPERQSIIRTDTEQILGVFKCGYTIHPYRETLSTFTHQIFDDAEVGVAAVGLLRKGGVAFLQAKLPKSYEVGGFGYQPYITAATSVDGTLATTFGVGASAAVCDNTLDLALARAVASFKIKHSAKSLGRVQDARERLGVQLEGVAEEMDTLINDLLKIDVTEKQFEQWVDAVTPLPEPQQTKTGGPGRSFTLAENKRNELFRLWTKDEKVHPWAGTALGVVQAANTYRTWTGTVKGTDGGRIERNMLNDVTGVTARQDAEAIDALAKVLDKRLVLA